jgi:nucleoside-diphosphate-sugar epimerase
MGRTELPSYTKGTRDGNIIQPDEVVLVTGANGFVGSRVVSTLVSYGFTRVRCLVRSMAKGEVLKGIAGESERGKIEIMKGNLLSRDDCRAAADGVSVVYHLAAGVGKSFPDCFLNSAVTTRNLLDAVIKESSLKRFVNISSLAVYANDRLRRGALLDESCEVENELDQRYESYVYGKGKQDEIVLKYANESGLPYVIVRPGVVFGPGKSQITGRIGIDTFGIFLHLGLRNVIPFTYVDNCAEAIVLGGLRKGIDGEVFNIVDDHLPRSSQYLSLCKNRVGRFLSFPMPYPAFYAFCWLWERYSKYSEGQIPPVFNTKRCAVYWKGNKYSNKKAKELLSWAPRVKMEEGLESFFRYARGVKKAQ